jgi:hypothetical protein
MKRVLFFFLLLSSYLSLAQSTYPELLVLPRASDRVKMEAKTEVAENYKNFWPIATSSLLTLTAGIYSELYKNDGYVGTTQSNWTPDDVSRNAMLADAWGLAWLGASYWMMKNYTPYNSATKEVSSLAGTNANEQVIRERISEERMASAKRTGQLLTWSYALGNILICSNLSGKSTGGVSQFASVCAASSILPLVINTTWASVYDSQMDYRKKIYGSVASLSASPIFMANNRGSLDPGLGLSLSF